MDEEQERPTSSEEENYGNRNEGENEGIAQQAEDSQVTRAVQSGGDGRPPIQETGDGYTQIPQPTQDGANAASDLEEELGGVIIDVLVRAVETSLVIVAEL
ncbi:Hypothetical predicted protein [Paramuricea clavata]|uniref:Uncharacterized protein n=1 Tax=Paramuricea clavata TaxID=317549 RepID=A0A6S7G405_PARCT|nr:Hypothetical predicted protein [Paramuricea clavata]